MSVAEEVVDTLNNNPVEDSGGDPFWILDLNPDMQP